MPPSLTGDAATSTNAPQSPAMEAGVRQRRSGLNLPIDGAIAKREPVVAKQIDKQSLDYVLRSGLAGGLAGCAVSTLVALCPLF
jgi:hypothetical protein